MRRSLGIFLCIAFVSHLGFAFNESTNDGGPLRYVTRPLTLGKLLKEINYGDHDVVANILEQESVRRQSEVLDDLLNPPANIRLTPLMSAVAFKKTLVDAQVPEIIDALFHYGARADFALGCEINTKRSKTGIFYPGWTAMHIAVRTRQPEAVLKRIYYHGGDFLRKDQGGWTPLELAIYEKNVVAYRFFLRVIASQTSRINVCEMVVDFTKCMNIASKKSLKRCKDADLLWASLQKEYVTEARFCNARPSLTQSTDTNAYASDNESLSTSSVIVHDDELDGEIHRNNELTDWSAFLCGAKTNHVHEDDTDASATSDLENNDSDVSDDENDQALKDRCEIRRQNEEPNNQTVPTLLHTTEIKLSAHDHHADASPKPVTLLRRNFLYSVPVMIGISIFTGVLLYVNSLEIVS